jgi:hypothetical protein
MYRLQTMLTHFRLNSIHNHGPLRVSWYKLKEEDGEIQGECMSYEELIALTNYATQNKINFGVQNYYSCSEENLPYFTEYDLIPLNQRQPKFLILRKDPKMQLLRGEIYAFMDIELLNESGASNHTYRLNFDLVGEIELDL